MAESSSYEVSKGIFNDENFIKYFTLVCHYYQFNSEDWYEERDKVYENKRLEINKILSTVELDEVIKEIILNRYMVSMFFISFCTSFEIEKFQLENTIKQVIKAFSNSPTKKIFNDFYEPFSCYEVKNKPIDKKQKDNLETQEEKIIKDYKEKLKNAHINISKLDDKIEGLEQRIEKTKEIWEENKQLNLENERLKEIIKNIYAELPEFSSSRPFYSNIINQLNQGRKLAKSAEPKTVSTSLPNPESNSMPKLPLPSNN
ncbi:MAG: hypothetical protein IPL99_03740, partial [Candidatus Competibacteraceae bacterium]|nr:hypothetical protein [Candidatus Competibacteraceae bacterium]